LYVLILTGIQAQAATQEETLTVAAAPHSEAAPPDRQVTLGNQGKQEIRNTPWSVQQVSPTLKL
ncbi:hypothetical protein, partial [Erwinia sp. PsM31]|uniref:hypothetical protein n=1 Tax=Erwinia sp. PsM31 TaxID=3030535 RepID=UPI00263B05C7